VLETSSDDDALIRALGHLTPENQRRLSVVLTEQLTEVFRAMRVIEQRTRYTSEIGRNMLVDVLAHLGTLAARTDLTTEQQASQLAKIEEHLRRALIEHPEEVLRLRVAAVADRWAVYMRVAFPLRHEAALTMGAPKHFELEADRKRIDELLESARAAKPEEATWDETLQASANMTEGAHLAGELGDKIEHCIGVAERVLEERRLAADREATERRDAERRDAEAHRQNRRRDRQWAAALAVSASAAIIGWIV